MLGWLFLLGGAIVVVSIVLIQVNALRGERPELLRAIRLRYLGIGLMLVLPGAWIATTAIVGGWNPSRLVGGLMMMGFGALYLYARGGIGPNFPRS